MRLYLGNLFRNAGITAVEREQAGSEISRGSLTWTGSPTTLLCTASRGKLCFMMGRQFVALLRLLSSKFKRSGAILPAPESLHENPWTRWKRQGERFLQFLSSSPIAQVRGDKVVFTEEFLAAPQSQQNCL